MKEPSAVTLLTAFNAGFAMTDMILLGTVVRRFGSRIGPHVKRNAFQWSQWELPAAGFAYAGGIWSDKLVMWYGTSANGLVVANVLRTMPSYDTAMFWAQMASIPVMAIAFVHVQTDLNNLFQRLYGRLGQHTSLREISIAMQKLQKCVISSVAKLFVTLAVVATLTILLSFVFMNELGLRPTYMSILRVALWAMAFHSSAMFCFAYLLYFDLRRQALLVVLSYGIANTALTWFLLPLGQAYYGYGSMIAAALTFILAFTIILRELPWLHYHAFITNNASVKRT